MEATYTFPNSVKVEPLVNGMTIVAIPDREYAVEGEYIHFDELILHGLLEGCSYRGHRLKMLYASEHIGQLIDMSGARGPLLRGALFHIEGPV